MEHRRQRRDRRAGKYGTRLSSDNIDRLRPLLFHDPMLDDALEVADHCRIVQVHIRATMALNELVHSLQIETGLGRRF